MTFDPSAAALPGSGVFGLPHSEAEAAVVLVPVPFEATTSYGGGTAGGPAAILEASRQVDLRDLETGRPYEAGIHMIPEPAAIAALGARARSAAEPVIAAGGPGGDPALLAAVEEVNRASRELNAWLEREVTRLLDAGKRVGTLGGDHAVSFGAIAAHARRFPGLGVLHVDAHADLRRAYEGFEDSHASILFNVLTRLPEVSRLVQVGIRDVSDDELAFAASQGERVVLHSDAAEAEARFRGEPWATRARAIVSALPRDVYVTFDVDGLDPALCPHTGTPVPGGLSFNEASALLRAVVETGRRIVGFDLVEVAPGPEGDWDANVGARLLYKLIGWALRSWDRSPGAAGA